MYPFVEAHLEHCTAQGFSTDTTIPDRREVLERVIREVGDLHRATTQQLVGWLSRAGWSPQTRSTYYTHLNGYLAWAHGQGHIGTNPLETMDRPKVPYLRPRGITDEAYTTVLRRAVEPWLTGAVLAAYAGLRCCEVVRLAREDITEAPPRGRIRVNGKGGRVDEIPLSPGIWSHVADRPLGLLLRTRLRHRPYGAHLWSNLFAEYCRGELGVNVTMHDLRRKYADRLRRAGVDVEIIRELMRHRSLATTQRYLNPGEEEREAAIQALPLVA